MTDDFTVEVFDYAYTKQAQVSRYESCWVEWSHVLDVGAGELVLNEKSNPKLTELLYTLPRQPLPVLVTVNGVRWPGRVVQVAVQRTANSAAGTMTCSLLSEAIWLRYMLASQNGSNPALDSMPEFDTQTGPIATVAAHFINAAAQRLGVPVAAVVPLDDETETVTLQGRYPATVFDVIGTSVDANQLTLGVDLWLPGAPALDGIADPGGPLILFTPQAVSSQPAVRWSESSGKLSSVAFQLTAATGYRANVGLTGTGAAKVYDTVIDPELLGPPSPYALPEVGIDASNATLGAQSQQAGTDELVKRRGGFSGAFTVLDGAPYTFGTDYHAGDYATVFAGNHPYLSRISKVRATNTPKEGLVITPSLGDVDLQLSPVAMLGQALASVQQQTRLLQGR